MKMAVLGVLLPWLAVAEPVTYRVVPNESRFTIKVGAAGLLKMFGHDHRIEARDLAGRVEWNPEAPETSKFVLEVQAASLTVADEELSEEDRKKVQSDMETKALALPQHPRIAFESSEVKVEKSEGSAQRLKLRGQLVLRGVTKPVEVPLLLAVEGDRLTARGEMKLESDQWGVPQITAAGGSVKTKEELELAYEIVAVRE